MAECPVNVAVVPQLEAVVRLDCDDYSCGSDRSLESDDAECIIQSNSGVDGDKVDVASSQTQRKRRHSSRRHKGGSRHRQKRYHPYSVIEDGLVQLKQKSLEIQEKESAAALIRYEGVGQFMTYPVAPFNSTQFLMDEHNDSSPPSVEAWCSPQDPTFHSWAYTPSEVVHERVVFETRDEFSDCFNTAHAESLHNLPKVELVRHYISLEEKITELRKKVVVKENLMVRDDNLCLEDGRHHDSESVFDSVCKDTNSLSSVNEEFIDLSAINQSTVTVDKTSILCFDSTFSS